MKVKATKIGFFGGRTRNPDDEFELDSKKQFSDEWMVEVAPKKAREQKPSEESKQDSKPAADDKQDAVVVGDIREAVALALEELDHNNDEHWTEDGLPAMKAIEAIVGHSGVKRSDVEAVDPSFRRKKRDNDNEVI